MKDWNFCSISRSEKNSWSLKLAEGERCMTKSMCITGCGPASTIACWDDIQESHIMWSFSSIAIANNTDSWGTQIPAIATIHS
jgi:hypothetical protein